MRKYVYFGITVFKSMNVYKLDLMFKVAGAVILVTAMREIWLSMYRNMPALAADTGVDAKAMATYAIVSVIIGMLLAPGMAGEMGNKVSTGAIVADFLKPWNWMLMYLAKSAASAVFSLVFVVIPLCASISLIYPINVPDAGRMLLFTVSAAFAFLLSFCLNFCVGLLAFRFTQSWGFDVMREGLVRVCSGFLIPLWFFPDALAAILHWLPFQGIYFIPLSIYIGQKSGAELAGAIGIQAAWIAVLFLSGQAMLHRERRRLATAGG
jgi:ABC-2 type transport system permease protein